MTRDMKKILYFHWNEEEAKQNTKKIIKFGVDVKLGVINSQSDFKTIRQNPPDLFIIDLTRLPSHGREVGVGLRSYKSTRNIPIIILEGEKDKVERVKQVLPDAFFAHWKNLKSVIQKANSSNHEIFLSKKNVLEAYWNTPLVQKLGIKENMSVGIIDSPKEIKKILGVLPTGAKLSKISPSKFEMIFLFVLFMSGLDSNFESMNDSLSENGSVWIFWPKQASGFITDLNQHEVRSYGLARGYVDYKVCSLNEFWSGLKFSRRKK